MRQWRKGVAAWKIGDTLYLSVVFTWDVKKAVAAAKKHKGPVVVGGPAAMLMRDRFDGIAEVRQISEDFEPILMHNPLASFSTRGCPRKCGFCAVPRIEGKFREIWPFRAAPMMCDNNFLDSTRKHRLRVIRKLKRFPLVDFNQGLDARKWTPLIASDMANLRLHARFAFDHTKDEIAVVDAIRLCRAKTTKKVSVYVLIGYKDTPEDALHRLEVVRREKALPNPMRYQPLDAEKKNCFVPSNWPEAELKKMMRYYSRLRFVSRIPYKDFDNKATRATLRAKI